jgi:hypothetical protein
MQIANDTFSKAMNLIRDNPLLRVIEAEPRIRLRQNSRQLFPDFLQICVLLISPLSRRCCDRRIKSN